MMRPIHPRRLLARISPLLILVPLAAWTLLPFFWIIVNSLKTPLEYSDDPLGIPHTLTFDAFASIWTHGRMADALMSSTLVVAAAVFIGVAIAAASAFALSHLYFRWRSLMLILIGAMAILPVSAQFIPLYVLLARLGLVETQIGLITLYITFVIPFGTFFLAAYMRGIPRELFQAAECDGASAWRAFISIALPLSRPPLVALITLQFLGLWNETFFGVLLLGGQTRTVTVALASQQGYFASEVQVAAQAAIAIIPPLIVFLLFQRSIRQGLVAGALK
jgi:ABC-type glycerol-3-phosphate transport system permease component